MDILIPILLIIALIIANGGFVAAEFAIIGAPRATIERRAAQGDRRAQSVNRILHDPRRQDRYIATAQLGITFASLGLGMYGEHILAEWILHGLARWDGPAWLASHALASIVAVAILTYFHIVVGEMVPKSLALSHAERTVLWITGPMLAIKAALLPLVIALNGIGNFILRRMGVHRELTTSHFHTPEDLELIVEESEKGGMLRAESSRLVRELFDFAELTAGEVMLPRVRIGALELGATREDLAAAIKEHPHTRYPVYGEHLDDIAGVIHIKRLLRLISEGRTLEREDLNGAAFVPETAELDAVIKAMNAAKTELAIVMDEHGGVAGMLTVADLSAEVVGELRAPALAGSTFHRVPGTVRLDELSEQLGVPVEHEAVDTVSGLVLALLNRPAQNGDVVLWNGVHIEVTRTRGRGVGECLVGIDVPPGA